MRGHRLDQVEQPLNIHNSNLCARLTADHATEGGECAILLLVCRGELNEGVSAGVGRGGKIEADREVGE